MSEDKDSHSGVVKSQLLTSQDPKDSGSASKNSAQKFQTPTFNNGEPTEQVLFNQTISLPQDVKKQKSSPQKARTKKNNAQKAILQEAYNNHIFWTKKLLLNLVEQTGLTEYQVYKWAWDKKKREAGAEAANAMMKSQKQTDHASIQSQTQSESLNQSIMSQQQSNSMDKMNLPKSQGAIMLNTKNIYKTSDERILMINKQKEIHNSEYQTPPRKQKQCMVNESSARQSNLDQSKALSITDSNQEESQENKDQDMDFMVKLSILKESGQLKQSTINDLQKFFQKQRTQQTPQKTEEEDIQSEQKIDDMGQDNQKIRAIRSYQNMQQHLERGFQSGPQLIEETMERKIIKRTHPESKNLSSDYPEKNLATQEESMRQNHYQHPHFNWDSISEQEEVHTTRRQLKYQQKDSQRNARIDRNHNVEYTSIRPDGQIIAYRYINSPQKNHTSRGQGRNVQNQRFYGQQSQHPTQHIQYVYEAPFQGQQHAAHARFYEERRGYPYPIDIPGHESEHSTCQKPHFSYSNNDYNPIRVPHPSYFQPVFSSKDHGSKHSANEGSHVTQFSQCPTIKQTGPNVDVPEQMIIPSKDQEHVETPNNISKQ